MSKRRRGEGAGAGGDADYQRKDQVFLRNLHEDFVEQDIEKLLGDYGPIKRVDLIKTTDSEGTKHSRGFGFVRFALEEDAAKAAAALNGKEVMGKHINCEIALKKGAKREKSAQAAPRPEAKTNAAPSASPVKPKSATAAPPQNATAPAKAETEALANGKSVAAAAADEPVAVLQRTESAEARTVVIFGIAPDLTSKQLQKRLKKVVTVEKLDVESAAAEGCLPPGRLARVRCASKAEATKLAARLDGHVIHEHKIRLRRATDVVAASDVRRRKELRLIVRNLPFEVTEKALGEAFSEFGPLSEVHIPTVEVTFNRKDRHTGEESAVTKRKSRGFGFVQFSCRADAAKVVKDHGIMTVGGRQVAVDYAVSKDRFKAAEAPKAAANDAEMDEQAAKTAANGDGSEHEGSGDVENGVNEAEDQPIDSDAAQANTGVGDLDPTGNESDDEQGDEEIADSDQEGSLDGSDPEVELEEEEELEENGEGEEAENESDASGSENENDAASAGTAAARSKQQQKQEKQKQEKQKQEKQQQQKERKSDVGQGCTIFVRNVPFDADEEDLRDVFETFGRVRMALLVKSKDTGFNRGTAFVKFADREGADGCLTAAGAAGSLGAAGPGRPVAGKAAAAAAAVAANGGSGTLSMLGRELYVARAVDKDEAGRLALSGGGNNKKRPGKRDKRCLYLADEGLLEEGGAAAEGVPKADIEKRRKARQEKKSKLKSPLFFVSPTRLSVRNLGRHVDDATLKTLFVTAARNGLREGKASANDELALRQAKEAEATELAPEKIAVPPVGVKSVVKAKVLRDLDRKPSAEDASPLPPSKGYGFVEFSCHAHALAALRHVNNNPAHSKFARRTSAGAASTLAGETPRLIVEFAVENHRKLKQQEARKVKTEKRQKDLATLGLRADGTALPDDEAAAGGGGKKASRGKRQREKGRLKKQESGGGGDGDSKSVSEEAAAAAAASGGGSGSGAGAQNGKPGKRAKVVGKKNGGGETTKQAAAGAAASKKPAVVLSDKKKKGGKRKRDETSERADPEAALLADVDVNGNGAIAAAAAAGGGQQQQQEGRKKKKKKKAAVDSLAVMDKEDAKVELLERAYVGKVRGEEELGSSKAKRARVNGGEPEAFKEPGKRRWFEGQ